MEKTPKEMLRAYVDSQKFNSTTEIMDAMKEMFRDVLQQVMESDLDTALGYERSQRVSDSGVENKPRNY
ncbi:MAG: IS256 family transposase, partial [Oscillospiraceae bacterium]|nr:IS256 family transposase [Oscillospiraceae bacterium]